MSAQSKRLIYLSAHTELSAYIVLMKIRPKLWKLVRL